MDDFLALTTAGRLPHHFHGQTAHFRWHWLDCGILQLIPMNPAIVRWCCQPGFMVMKPRRLKSPIYCCVSYFAGSYRYAGGCW